MANGLDLVVDCSSLLYRAYYANPNEQVDIVMGLAMHGAFMTANKYFKMFKPDRVVMCFDRHNWRVDYSKSDKCYSGRIYKGERRKDQTPAQAAKYKAFKSHIIEFESIIRDHTSIIVLAEHLLEGDDCVAGWITRHPERKHIIVSGDGDMIQLLRFPNVELYDPGKQKKIDCPDPEFYLFEKLFRGEPKGTDNVCPAYPRLRSTKIEAAYKDAFELTNLRNSTWEDPLTNRKMEVGKLLDENKLLMDLTAQPEEIQDVIDEMIVKALMKKTKFSHFHFMKFLGKHELKNIANSLEQFMPMLAK